ncbi:MAG TPA: tripartite tricarboxylate transporter substrate binding protein [Burkholderiales bacterium]|nr:tripartite tricarboxylate transporter substrate binding protein [Burkholderiales bacterium]
MARSSDRCAESRTAFSPESASLLRFSRSSDSRAVARDPALQVIVDNRVGAGSTVGTDIVAKAPPDGHTVLFTNNGIAYNPALYPKLPYDTFRDLVSVGLMGTTASVLVVHPTLSAKNVGELIALMKAKPAQLNYGTGGVGGAVHLAFELFQTMAGVKATHIPYKGVGPALLDTVGGRVQLMMAGLPPALVHVKANRLRALGVSTAKRASSLPEVPTISESGVPGYEYVTWYAMLAPAAVPKPVIAKLSETGVSALSNAEVRERFSQQGVEPETSTPERFASMLRGEVVRWTKVIRTAGISPE